MKKIIYPKHQKFKIYSDLNDKPTKIMPIPKPFKF